MKTQEQISKVVRASEVVKVTSGVARQVLAGAKWVSLGRGFARVVSFTLEGDELVVVVEYRSRPRSRARAETPLPSSTG